MKVVFLPLLERLGVEVVLLPLSKGAVGVEVVLLPLLEVEVLFPLVKGVERMERELLQAEGVQSILLPWAVEVKEVLLSSVEAVLRLTKVRVGVLP